MNLKFSRIFIAFCFGICILFGGCNFFTEKAYCMNDFKKLILGDFKSIDEVIGIFPTGIEEVTARVKFCKEFAKKNLDEFFKISSESRTFDNTIRKFDDLKNSFGIGVHSFAAFELVCQDETLRNACHDAAIELSKFSVDLFFDKKIYEVFKQYIENVGKTEKLNNEEQYYLQEAIKDFKRSGFDLPEDKFLKIKELEKEIEELGLEFDKNINTDKSFIVVDEKDLTGLEKDFIESLSKDDDGKIILKCDYPTYFSVMQNCTNAEIRKKYYFVFNNRAYPKNIEILDLIIKKRDQLAKVLGFESFAALDLDGEMAKNSKRVNSFLTDLAEKTMIKMKKEFDLLNKNLPDGVLLDNDGKMSPWDFSFVKESYKKKHFNIDERKVAEYFPVDNTLTKIFEIYQKFLSLRFEEIQVDGLWCKDVKVVNIYDQSNKLRGILFLDLYPRDDKYSHACMSDLIPTIKFKNKEVPAVILVIANFPKATKEKPALLKHADVETFFHEFGHAMHGLLGQTELAGFSGTNVKRDFVEMPSQMFEEWLWDKDVLRFISSHYKTGDSLPDDIIDKKIELKKLVSGYFVTRQCNLSLIALNYFEAGETKDTNKILKDLHERYLKQICFEPKTHFQAAFGHLFGYSAKYYGYMWSKVFALDMFYNIKEEGLLNPEAGNRLIKFILSKGGSVDPEILLKDFLGREPNQEAFLKDLGI